MKNRFINWLLSLKAVQEHLATQPDETQQAIDEIVERARDIVRRWKPYEHNTGYVEVLKDLKISTVGIEEGSLTTVIMVHGGGMFTGLEISFYGEGLEDYSLVIRPSKLPTTTNPAKPLKSQIDYMLQKFPKHLFV